jgi:hypothetical protein
VLLLAGGTSLESDIGRPAVKLLAPDRRLHWLEARSPKLLNAGPMTMPSRLFAERWKYSIFLEKSVQMLAPPGYDQRQMTKMRGRRSRCKRVAKSKRGSDESG